MASEDVIELDSSDDEAEPAPKKKKPPPNAMVHIPTKFPGVTIKPAKSSSSSIPRASATKPITIQSVNLNTNQIKSKSGPVRIPINKCNIKDAKYNPQIQNKGLINPLHLANNLSKRQIVIKKIPSNKRPRPAFEIQGTKVLNNLPPGITVKPVHKNPFTIRPVLKPGVSGIVRKSQTNTLKKAEVLTVEIDDEDVIESSTASPQWYLRPEDHKLGDKSEQNQETTMEVDNENPSMEEQNNKEPATKELVEITIEDSPMKPMNTKQQEIGKELTITIEDSPVKPIAKKNKKVKSDDENNDSTGDTAPQSKKKLEYQNNSGRTEKDQVEIEIDIKQTDDDSENKTKVESPKEKTNEGDEKSPKNKLESEKENQSDSAVLGENKDEEFHPVYKKFIEMCFQLENSKDMEKIVEKKIKSYYKQCRVEYVESEEFIDMVSSKIMAMKASPGKMYLYIKDIVDELNLQRKMTKSIIPSREDVNKELQEPCSGTQWSIASSSCSLNKIIIRKVSGAEESPDVMQYVETQYDSKKRRQIRKLEKTIKKLHRAIQKLEEQEVDFDDDEDSVYLLTERYKERMVRVHAKFCQLTNTKMPSEPRIHIEARPGRPTGPAKKLEKWINRKVPIGTPLPFPDFHDVLRCVRDANEEEKLGWNDFDIMEEARDLFTRCGKKLQRRRQENEWRIAASRISADPDPAEKSVELKQRLDENKTEAAKKETELLNKYVDRQNQLKLEAEEIGDKEAEESPIESEEEEEVVEDSNSMEDKQKRKQRLKRLLKEKSKKDEDKENEASKCVIEGDDKNKAKEDESEEKGVNKELVEKLEEETSNKIDMVIETLPTEKEDTTEKEKEKDKETENEEKQNINENDSDSNKVESDIDELHLLQKLHSENEANSSALDSDSDTPIAISDTLESDSEMDNGALPPCDVISIENSSYSESESTVDTIFSEINSTNKQDLEKKVSDCIEIEYSSAGIEETNSETIPVVEDAITEEVEEENILLATSDEEESNKVANLVSEDTCINLRDDNISISETTIHGGTVEEENIDNNENIGQDNNNAVEIVENIVDDDENNCTLDITQEFSEEGENSMEGENNENIIEGENNENIIQGENIIEGENNQNIIQGENIIEGENNENYVEGEFSKNIMKLENNENILEDENNDNVMEYENIIESENNAEVDNSSMTDAFQECPVDHDSRNLNDSPKEILDIRCVLDANSVESTELQIENENKDVESREQIENIESHESKSVDQDMTTGFNDSNINIQETIDVHEEETAEMIATTDASYEKTVEV